jgi:hypothetical protein
MKCRRPLGLDDVPVNFSGFLRSEQKFIGDAPDFCTRDHELMVNVRNKNCAGEFGVAVHERFHVRRAGGSADAVGHVNREEIRGHYETVHRFKADVVGIHMIRFFPAQSFYCRVRFGAQARRFGADERVFAMGFVPDRHKVRAQFGGQLAGAQLRLALVPKPVAQTEGKFAQQQVSVHNFLTFQHTCVCHWVQAVRQRFNS